MRCRKSSPNIYIYAVYTDISLVKSRHKLNGLVSKNNFVLYKDKALVAILIRHYLTSKTI